MRRLLLVAFALALTAGCGSSTDTADKPAKDSGNTTTSEAELVQKRYADCLTKLDAKLADDGPRWVAFDTKDGGYLVFGVKKMANGKTLTVPKDERATAMLESVGC